MSRNTEHQDIKILLKSLQGKPVFILTKFNIRYRTNNLQLGEDFVKFRDKFDVEVFLSLDQIAQVTEVSNA